jgi:hypothetical protein
MASAQSLRALHIIDLMKPRRANKRTGRAFNNMVIGASRISRSIIHERFPMQNMRLLGQVNP